MASVVSGARSHNTLKVLQTMNRQQWIIFCKTPLAQFPVGIWVQMLTMTLQGIPKHCGKV